MSNTDRDSMLERWADGMERLEQYYEGIYGPPATPPSLPPITTRDAMLEAIADGMERAKRNINKKSSTYHSDSVAYVKTVPAGNVHYASIEQIGGKTLVWNQLVDSGTTTVATISGHKYYTLIDGTASIVNGGSAITIVDDTSDMVTDLTLCYGSGNEPTTVQEFTSKFPASYYPYNAGTLLSAGVTEVVSKDTNNITIDTYSIPAEVQALDGYGWSAGTAYNYVDFERKVFVKNVGAVDLGTVDFSSLSTPENHVFRTTQSAFPNIKPSAHNNYTVNAISSMYMVIAYTPITANDNLRFAVSIESNNRVVFINQAYSTVGSFTSAMNGVYLYYELATPQEIDISEYLTDDNLIEVESGGTLSFPNSNGDDYRINVPSSVTFVVGEP